MNIKALLLAIFVVTTKSQRVICDVDGANATYTETIDGELRRITATGCPNVE